MDQSWCLYCMSHLENGVCPNHCPSVPANEPHMLQPGTLLNGRYLVCRSLGHGGFGITYIGRDTVLDIPVAVKEFFPTGIATRDIAQTSEIHVTGTQNRESLQREVEKFLNETRTLAQFLDEPGIVTVRDFFSANGTAYIVTEYIKGETLRAYQTRLGRIPLEELLVLLAPVCKSLTKVHQTGLIHRDISPDNIMITQDGRAKLLDFGTVRSASLAGEHTMSVIQKPGYAQEERYRRRGEQGAWTDVYGLAATIYRCITGVTPDDAFQRMYQDELQPPSKLGVSISPMQEAALMKGLAIRHEERYQSVDALISALSAKEDEDHEQTRQSFGAQGRTEPAQKESRPEERREVTETALIWGVAGKAAEEKNAAEPVQADAARSAAVQLEKQKKSAPWGHAASRGR